MHHRGNMAVFRLALFLLFIGGAAAQAQIYPQNVAVLRGSQARFNCSTTNAQFMMWSLNGVFVVTIQMYTWTSSDPRYSATNYSTPGSYKWQFMIDNVARGDVGQVACQVLGATAQAASLSVQEQGSVKITGGNQIVTQGVPTNFQCLATGWYPEPNVSWSVNGVVEKYCTDSSVLQGNVFNTNCTLTLTAAKNSSVMCLVSVPAMSSPEKSIVVLTVVPKAVTRDQTILIAVTVAFSAAALLFLIIFGIIFFCKRRKKEKSGYQEELRRARVQSQHRTPVTTDARGRDIRGYATDGRYGQDYNGGVWHTNYSPKQQTSYPRDDFFDDSHRNHRHMTML